MCLGAILMTCEKEKREDEDYYICFWIQRTAGWCEAVKKAVGTALGAAARNFCLWERESRRRRNHAVICGRI